MLSLSSKILRQTASLIIDNRACIHGSGFLIAYNGFKHGLVGFDFLKRRSSIEGSACEIPKNATTSCASYLSSNSIYHKKKLN